MSISRVGAVLALAATGFAGPAFAQPQDFALPPGILEQTRQLADNSIRFCINTASVLAPLDRAVAQAIADALLLDAEFYAVETPFAIVPYDFRIPFPARELYVIFNNHCDAFMGMRLSVGNMPEWMTISQPYFTTRAVVATADAAIDDWEALPDGASIASRMAAPGDVALTAYLRSLPEFGRPTRIPYPDYGLAIARLLDGSAAAAFVWEPALWFATDGAPEAGGVAHVFEPPFAVPPIAFGVAFFADDSFTRGLVDTALVALDQSGALAAVIEREVPVPR